MKLEFEWQEAPGVRDSVLAATWARLSLVAGGQCAFEAIDLRSDSRRTGVYGSLFPLAEWIVEHWWRLLYEPAPCSLVPSGRESKPVMRGWVRCHNLLAARDGGALPDLTLVRDGGEILAQWVPDRAPQISTRLRFVGQGDVREPAEEVERSLAAFVDSVLARLDEKLQDNEGVRFLARSWNAIRSADPSEVDLCRSMAMMGADPYDPNEATEALAAVVERVAGMMPDELKVDFFEGTDASSAETNLGWVERALGRLRKSINGNRLPAVEPVQAGTAHEVGYETARRVRTQLLGLSPSDLVDDLDDLLVDRLGWYSDCFDTVEGDSHMDGMVGLDDASSAPLLVVADRRSEHAQRFRLARAAFFTATDNLGARARLLTRAVTPQQRASRAFAAELLAPAAALAQCVSTKVSENEVEDLSGKFRVSVHVIRHQIENHGLAVLET